VYLCVYAWVRVGHRSVHVCTDCELTRHTPLYPSRTLCIHTHTRHSLTQQPQIYTHAPTTHRHFSDRPAEKNEVTKKPKRRRPLWPSAHRHGLYDDPSGESDFEEGEGDEEEEDRGRGGGVEPAEAPRPPSGAGEGGGGGALGMGCPYLGCTYNQEQSFAARVSTSPSIPPPPYKTILRTQNTNIKHTQASTSSQASRASS
jgi:hypothetical protein